jgi:hypothetical protein
MKGSVLGGIDGLLEKQRQQMRGEEAAALRQLRCRLAEVEALLRAEREQQGKGSADLHAKTVGCHAGTRAVWPGGAWGRLGVPGGACVAPP